MRAVIAYYDVVRERERRALAAEDGDSGEGQDGTTGSLDAQPMTLGYTGQSWRTGGIGVESHRWQQSANVWPDQYSVG